MTTTAAAENSARRSKRRAAEIAKAAMSGSTQNNQIEVVEPDSKKRKSVPKKTKSPLLTEQTPARKPDPEKEPPKEEDISELTNSGDGGAPEEDETEGDPHVFEKTSSSVSPMKKRVTAKRTVDEEEENNTFIGEPIPEEEARNKWPKRYEKNYAKRGSITNNGLDEDELKAKRHYTQARVDGSLYDLYDNVYVKAEEGVADYICRIVEFFEGCDNGLYFCAQWFFRPEDTIIGDASSPKDATSDYSHDNRRVFLSEERNDNQLSCILSKISIIRVPPNIDLSAKRKSIPSCDLYYDMSYSIAYSTFANIPCDNLEGGMSLPFYHSSNISQKSDVDSEPSTSNRKSQLLLLDLYSGCGGMSTGLCLGADISGLSIQTRWAVDKNSDACESLKFNHPETEIRCEQAEDFLGVLREWEKLCSKFGCGNQNIPPELVISDVDEEVDQSTVASGEFEVGKILGICFGKTDNLGEVGLKFKVRWKGYGPSDDTWEPIEGLGNCDERIGEFVRHGYNKNILPLPGTVDIICGGPPCQGISGFNRFRNFADPLQDDKNMQMVVFMEIIEFLKPRFVLMENVVDILKFAKGYLGRYALSRLVAMNYQSRLGIMAAGCYGLPQFRMRVFLWGARPTEKLPQFPLPTHDVIVRGGAPVKFESCVVAYEENQHRQLKKELFLSDAISDLPPVSNDEKLDEMDYVEDPKTDFQTFIRLSKEELMDLSPTVEKSSQKKKLLDHRPLQLNIDDYQRVCQVPKKKGANFRQLAGLVVGPDNKVQWDPEVKRVLLPSGKPLVPDYAMSYLDGKSSKPFGRLWWDETVPTVVTRAEPHNQVIVHPEQDRVLSIRENARLQGFPDYYKFFGSLKQRYTQIGNAVAVPVSRALGYALGQAVQQRCDEKPLLILPPHYPNKN